MIEPTPEMERAMYIALAAEEPGRHHAAVRTGLAAVLAIVERKHLARPTCVCLGADWPHVPSSARCTPPVDRRREARTADPHAHACVSCSPDGVLPGRGCINCRQTGMDQTPCTALGHTAQCPHGCCGGPRKPDTSPKLPCTKCGGPLTACTTCGKPAQCGETWCVECTPDGGFTITGSESTPGGEG